MTEETTTPTGHARLPVRDRPAPPPGLRLAVPPEQVPRRHRTMIRGPRGLPGAW